MFIYFKAVMDQIYFRGLAMILLAMTFLWIISILIKNVSIVDLFWGLGFVVLDIWYFVNEESFDFRQIILLVLVTIWGVRLSVYLAWRNIGKGEDFRYREFRKKYGENNYWWISYFQVFLLQAVLMWLISSSLWGANKFSGIESFNIFDFSGILVWIIGFIFEAGGDYQLTKFKLDKGNTGKVLDTGFWKYTRHPNYFGDSAVWWGFGLICIGAGSFWYVAGSVLMTLLIVKVSGVALLEKTLKIQKSEYLEYVHSTSSFFPWFKKKSIG